MDKLKLMKTANEIRKGIVSSVHSAKAGHPGGSLSAADIFTYLYFEELILTRKSRRRQTVTGSCFPRDILHRDFIQHWQRGAISRKRIC